MLKNLEEEKADKWNNSWIDIRAFVFLSFWGNYWSIYWCIYWRKNGGKRRLTRAIKIALGALAGFLGGTILKFAVSIYITILFVNQFFTIF